MNSRQLGFKPLEEDAATLRTWMGARSGGAGAAPDDALFLVLGINADLVNERVFTAGDGLDGTDGGAGGTYTLDVDVTDFIDTAYGLTEDTNNIRINAGDGLAFDTGALVVGLVDAWSGLEFSGGDLRVDEDAVFTWTGVHTHEADIILDDGSGDSPAVRFVGGSQDDEARIFLDDDAVAGNSDLAIRLCAADADSRFVIQSSTPAVVAYIDAAGNAGFTGHVAIGGDASVAADQVVVIDETVTALAGIYYGIFDRIVLNPGANYTTSVYGFSMSARVDSAFVQTAGHATGANIAINIKNAVAATVNQARVLRLASDAEDGTMTEAISIVLELTDVDTGDIGTSYGVKFAAPSVGVGGTITTMYGIYVPALTQAGTNYVLYSLGGDSYHAGDFSIGGTVAPSGQLHVDQSAGAGAQPVVFLDQGDVSEQHIVCSINGTDVDFPAIIELDVTGAPTMGWVDAADQFTLNKHLSLTAGDLYLASGFGLIYADSVAVGKVPVADGTRYVPGDVTVSIITDLAYAVPALTLGLANAAGAAETVLRTDATILVFDATVPNTIQCDDAAAAGAAGVAARRDHEHGIVCAAPGTNLSVSTSNAEGSSTSFARADHAHGIVTSSNPGAAAAILATAADGGVQLLRLGIGADPDTNNRITMVNGGTIGNTSCLLTFDTGTGKLGLTGDMAISSGLWVGRDASQTTGGIGYTGYLVSYKNSAEFAVYAFHGLTGALTGEDFDGDSFSTTAKTLIDLSLASGAHGFGVPAGVHAVSCEVSIRDSGSAGGDYYIILGPTNNAGEGKVVRCSGLPNDSWVSGDLLVPCDASGDIYYQIVASGAGTMDVYIRIWGYFI